MSVTQKAIVFTLGSPLIYFFLIKVAAAIFGLTGFPVGKILKILATDCKALLSTSWQEKATTGVIVLAATAFSTGFSIWPVLNEEYPLLESLFLGQIALSIWFMYPTMIYTFMFWAIRRLGEREVSQPCTIFRPDAAVLLSKWAFGFYNTWMVFLVSWLGALWLLGYSPLRAEAIAVFSAITFYLAILSSLILGLSFVVPIPKVQLSFTNDRYENDQVFYSIGIAGGLLAPFALYVYVRTPSVASSWFQTNVMSFVLVAVWVTSVVLLLMIRWGTGRTWRFLGEAESEKREREQEPETTGAHGTEVIDQNRHFRVRFRQFVLNYLFLLGAAVTLMALYPGSITSGISGGLSVVAVALLSHLWDEKPRNTAGYIIRGMAYLAFLIFHVAISVKLALFIRGM